MANFVLPVVGADDNTWGQKINDAITAINTELESGSAGAVNFYRRYIDNAWEVRGEQHPSIPRVWIKDNASIPNPPTDSTYFMLGVDLLLVATG